MAPSGKQHVVHVTSTDAKDDFSHLSVVEADIPTPGEGEVSGKHITCDPRITVIARMYA